MQKIMYQNRVCNVISRYQELMQLLNELDCDEDKKSHIVDLVSQSHSNEVVLLGKILHYIEKDKSDIDIPEFMKQKV